jgi:4-hydroxybenzoyl-CoA reductase subunit beta
MLRMDGFEFVRATDPADAVALWHAQPDSAYIAGGTDLLPNLKHRIVQAKTLVGVGDALPKGWAQVGEAHEIGAGTTLSALAQMSALPLLATAAGAVAGPQLRNMGTIGGNVLLDTRCLFYNQTEFWRKSLGYCLKAEGTWCHVVGGPKTCVATQSSDTVPALMALGARIRLLGPAGARELDLNDLFKFNGMDHLKLSAGELLTHVIVPVQPDGARGSYQKLRTRGAIDFPQLGVAIWGSLRGEGPSAQLDALRIVIGAVSPQPKALGGIDAFLGGPLSDEVIAAIAEQAFKSTRPQGSVHGDSAWRRHMARVFVRRGLLALRSGEAPAAVEGAPAAA